MGFSYGDDCEDIINPLLATDEHRYSRIKTDTTKLKLKSYHNVRPSFKALICVYLCASVAKNNHAA